MKVMIQESEHAESCNREVASKAVVAQSPAVGCGVKGEPGGDHIQSQAGVTGEGGRGQNASSD